MGASVKRARLQEKTEGEKRDSDAGLAGHTKRGEAAVRSRCRRGSRRTCPLVGGSTRGEGGMHMDTGHC